MAKQVDNSSLVLPSISHDHEVALLIAATSSSLVLMQKCIKTWPILLIYSSHFRNMNKGKSVCVTFDLQLEGKMRWSLWVSPNNSKGNQRWWIERQSRCQKGNGPRWEEEEEKKTCPPNLQLISWPEQQQQHRHISSSRTSRCQTLNVFIGRQTEGEECVPKTGCTLLPAAVSVVRIIANALGCCLCLTFNSSTGEPVSVEEGEKADGASQRPRLHLVYLSITACDGKIVAKHRRSERKRSFLFVLIWSCSTHSIPSFLISFAFKLFPAASRCGGISVSLILENLQEPLPS